MAVVVDRETQMHHDANLAQPLCTLYECPDVA